MVVIRLARGGSHKRPFFHLTVADSRNKRDGKFTERIGFFNPLARGNDTRLRIDLQRVEHWLGCGAQLSPRVASLVKEMRLDEEQRQGLAAWRQRRRQGRRARAAARSDAGTDAGTEEPKGDSSDSGS